jgi:hypothetical protein
MTSFYYKKISIIGDNGICKYILNSNNISNYYKTITTSTYTSKFNSNINENPLRTQYLILGTTDISSFSIANYIEYTSTTNININVPDWCNKIRAILIGGGGGGGSGSSNIKGNPVQSDTITSYNSQNVHVNNDIQHYHYNDCSLIHQNNTQNVHNNYDIQNPNLTHTHYTPYSAGTGGGGGGGGGFLYLSNIDITPSSNITINVGSGGASNVNGTNTSINFNSTNFTAYGGSGGSSGSGGSGGSCTSGYISVNGNGGSSTNTQSGGTGGTPGSGNYLSTNSSIINNGKGGSGGSGGNSSTDIAYSGTSGVSGNNGYCRIYYLLS